MFETSRRTHPLHTFRFWFVVVAAVVITVAWKFDLLPVRIGPADTGQLAQQTFVDVDSSEESPAVTSSEEIDLPFGDADHALQVPTIAPATARANTAVHRQTAELDPVSSMDAVFAEQFDSAHADAAPHPTTATKTSSFDNDEWPSGTTLPRNAPAPMAVSTDDFPHATGDVLQTSATAAAFESSYAAPMQTAAQPFGDQPSGQSSSASAGVDFTQIDRLLSSGLAADEIDAHRQLSTLYWKQPEVRDALRERIDTLAQQIYFLGGRHYMDAYQVQPGDMLQQIAREYDVSWQYLARLNRVDPKRVRTGQRLKVIKGPFSAIVDLSDYELTIHAHGYYVTRYPVGIGKDGSSPIGTFTVQEKLVDPTYYGPDGVINHDDPSNPLGERWIDIGNSYGIHGTIDPSSIGKNESKGCIRLHNDDVASVYDLLTIGSEVVIRP